MKHGAREGGEIAGDCDKGYETSEMCCPDEVETLYRTVFYGQTDSQIEGILIRESESREAGGCLSCEVQSPPATAGSNIVFRMGVHGVRESDTAT